MRTPQTPRRRGDDEALYCRCPHPERRDNAPQPKASAHPHRRRRHLRPGEHGSAGRVLPSTTRPTETNHQTEHSGGKRQSPLTPKAQRRAYEKHKDQQETRRRPTRLRAPAASPENLLQRYDLPPALYEPHPEFLCLPDGWGLRHQRVED
jgi:hypothetical protein